MYSHLPWAHFLPVESSEDCQRCYVSQIGEQALFLWVNNEAYLKNEFVKIEHDDKVSRKHTIVGRAIIILIWSRENTFREEVASKNRRCERE